MNRFGKAKIESLVSIEQIGLSTSGRTKIFGVYSKKDIERGLDGDIGIIKWHGPWRKYVYETGESFYDVDCLRYIADFIEKEMEVQKTLGKDERWAD